MAPHIDVLRTGPLGVNTCVVHLGGSAVFVVDPAACDFSGDATRIVDFLDAHALEPCAVVLTHGHFDHLSGIPGLRSRFPSLPILIHPADAASLGARSADVHAPQLAMLGFDAFLPSVSGLPAADFFLQEGMSLADRMPRCAVQGLEAWTVLHTPGHSGGSCCLYHRQAGLLLSGDTLFHLSYGRTDLPGGDDSAMKRSLSRLYAELPEDTLVYPGHDVYGFALGRSPV